MSPGSLAALVLALASLGGAVSAQTAPPAEAPAPRFLTGFTHPDTIQCQTINPGRRECTVPANVAGPYLIEAAGFATSTAPDSTLVLKIFVGKRNCIMLTRSKFTGPANLHLVCEVTLATEAPVTISVNMGARNATLNADGPKVGIAALSWDGVISIRGSEGGPLATAPAAPPAAPDAKDGAKPGPKKSH